MYFLLSAAIFAVVVLCFHGVLAHARRHPDAFAGEWTAVFTSVTFTAALAGSFLWLCATAVAMAPTLLSGLIIGVVSAIALGFAINVLVRRWRVKTAVLAVPPR